MLLPKTWLSRLTSGSQPDLLEGGEVTTDPTHKEEKEAPFAKELNLFFEKKLFSDEISSLRMIRQQKKDKNKYEMRGGKMSG